MTTTILQRLAIPVIVAALAMVSPVSATAAPIDDARALIGAIAATGDSERAWQLTQVVDSMSDAELETFAGSGIADLTTLINQQRVAIEQARELGFQPPADDGAPAPSFRDHDPSFPKFTDYTPDDVSCPNSPNQTEIDTIVTIRTTIVGAHVAYKIAKALYDSANPVCHQLVVAIGVGSNPQTAVCIGLGIAETVVHVLFDIADKVLELVDFCDEEVDYAKIRATYHGLEFVHDQLTDHDFDEKLQLATHDLEVRALISELLGRLIRIESKVDLLLKSQLQITMDRKSGRSRPSVFYEERFDELCGYAQEAVDDLPVVYLLHPETQALITQALALKATDPKLASDTCVKAFVRATAGSAALQ